MDELGKSTEIRCHACNEPSNMAKCSASLDRRDLTTENKSFVEMLYDAFGIRGQIICHGIAQEKGFEGQDKIKSLLPWQDVNSAQLAVEAFMYRKKCITLRDWLLLHY